MGQGAGREVWPRPSGGCHGYQSVTGRRYGRRHAYITFRPLKASRRFCSHGNRAEVEHWDELEENVSAARHTGSGGMSTVFQPFFPPSAVHPDVKPKTAKEGVAKKHLTNRRKPKIKCEGTRKPLPPVTTDDDEPDSSEEDEEGSGESGLWRRDSSDALSRRTNQRPAGEAVGGAVGGGGLWVTCCSASDEYMWGCGGRRSQPQACSRALWVNALSDSEGDSEERSAAGSRALWETSSRDWASLRASCRLADPEPSASWGDPSASWDAGETLQSSASGPAVARRGDLRDVAEPSGRRGLEELTPVRAKVRAEDQSDEDEDLWEDFDESLSGDEESITQHSLEEGEVPWLAASADANTDANTSSSEEGEDPVTMGDSGHFVHPDLFLLEGGDEDEDDEDDSSDSEELDADWRLLGDLGEELGVAQASSYVDTHLLTYIALEERLAQAMEAALAHLDSLSVEAEQAPPPAATSVIASLPRLQILQHSTTLDQCCAICCSDFLLGEVVITLPCNHSFHEACVALWLQKSGTCPVCRHVLQETTPLSSTHFLSHPEAAPSGR